jgi:hypothetical protein
MARRSCDRQRHGNRDADESTVPTSSKVSTAERDREDVVNRHLGAVLLVLTISPIGGRTVDQPSCRLAGEWTRDDNVQKVELYQAGSRWFGTLVSSTEKGAKQGFLMFKDFTYDEQKHCFKGTVVVPTSGMQAAADLVCLDDAHIRVTAHKLFLTKSFGFTRVKGH